MKLTKNYNTLKLSSLLQLEPNGASGSKRKKASDL